MIYKLYNIKQNIIITKILQCKNINGLIIMADIYIIGISSQNV
jgi:hypothetical protein